MIRPPRVAILGGRGIPARYGGFETLMEELSVRLVERGFEVTVYCRSHYTPASLESYRGVRLVVLPTVRTKYLDTPVHTFLATLHAAVAGYDVALVLNGANAPFLPLLTAAEIGTALNVDGVEKRRAKWGPLGRLVYAASERLATRLPDQLITDAEVIRNYYREQYGADSLVLRYGVDARPLPAGETLQRLGLTSRRYLLYVSRFEPENNPHRVVAAYRRVPGELPLVMVGDAPYAKGFIRSFTADADARVLFPGAIYGDGYRELLSHAAAYIQATEVGGTHPALVEALGYGNCVVANDTPEHREVAGDAALYFDVRRPSSLAGALDRVLADPTLAETLGARARHRAAERFGWEEIADAYAELVRRLSAHGS